MRRIFAILLAGAAIAALAASPAAAAWTGESELLGHGERTARDIHATSGGMLPPSRPRDSG